MQQLVPVLVARQDVDIQRRLALFAGRFNAGGEIHLQRMVVQHYFTGMGNQRGKAQVIACGLAASSRKRSARRLYRFSAREQ